jgi:hypothetical protein
MKKPNLLLKRDYRLVVISDLHCGHVVGLTPPQFQGKFLDEDVSKTNKYIKIQKAMWDFFQKEITQLQRESAIDIVVCNGDAIDGDGYLSNSTELITSDRLKQVAIAKNVIDFIGAPKNIIICGTGYHTGNAEDFESVLANQLDSKFENHCWLDINKQIFDIKHHMGGSASPAGNYSSIAKEALWSLLWQEVGNIPKPVKYLIRSHVHRYSYIENSLYSAMSTPALQGLGTKFGARRCSGTVDVGFLTFDISANGQVSMQKHLAKLEEQKAHAIIFK